MSSIPAIFLPRFQCCMDTLIQGIPGVSDYIDDILVTGRTTEEHLQNLDTVLRMLEEAGLHLNHEKCMFIEYLGHIIDEKGIHPTATKVQAIQDASTPRVWPEKPWSRLHLDFAGSYCGSMFLVLVDTHSKWMDVVMMKNITTAMTIEKLRIIFATHGIPQKIIDLHSQVSSSKSSLQRFTSLQHHTTHLPMDSLSEQSSRSSLD